MAADEKDGSVNGSGRLSRRSFVARVAATGAGFAIVPRHVLGKGLMAPSDTLNVAVVGVGGQGRSNLINLATQNIVALCDVDWDYANKGFARLDEEIRSQRERVDWPANTPRLDAQGRAEAPLTGLDRQRISAQMDGMVRLKDQHLPRAKRYQHYREMLQAGVERAAPHERLDCVEESVAELRVTSCGAGADESRPLPGQRAGFIV